MLLDTNHQNTIIQPHPYHRSSPAHLAPHHQAPYYSQTAPATPFHADDLDYDADHGAQSLTSSPISQISLLSVPQTSPLSTFDSIPAARGSLFDFSAQRGLSDLPDAALFANPAMMTDTWLSTQQFSATPRSRMSHQRESSLSSLGSNSPASPYSQNISHPHVVNDSPSDAYHGLPSDDFNYQLAKSYATPITHDQLYTAYPAYTSAAEHSAMANPRITVTNPKRKAGQALLHPEHMIGSRPVSVASSIVSDSPATPADEPDEQRRRRAVITENSFMREIPKLERTATDAYADELYSDHFTNNFSATASQVPVSPSNPLFADRIQAVNQQHLSAVQSPVSTASANKSPFMKGSPLAQMPVHDFQTGFPSHHQFREQKVARDVQAAQQQMAHQAGAPTPQTISPRDALLEYSANHTDANFPLFPPTSNGFDMDAMTKAVTQAQQDYTPLALDQPFNNFLPNSHLSSGIQVPQQYPFIPQRQQSSVPSLTNASLATSRMGSAETASDSSNVNMSQRPAVTSADGGTYTCTYHGCTLRFETPVLLQKHKREGHRQTHGLGGTRRPEAVVPGLPGSLYNTQHGPHKCDRINPSTGKPCNTVFSRPYDLTRHEDTIHNARKQKVRCDLCTDEKTFSRADALTRHYRVCHPEVEFPGKQRRRGGHTQ